MRCTGSCESPGQAKAHALVKPGARGGGPVTPGEVPETLEDSASIAKQPAARVNGQWKGYEDEGAGSGDLLSGAAVTVRTEALARQECLPVYLVNLKNEFCQITYKMNLKRENYL